LRFVQNLVKERYNQSHGHNALIADCQSTQWVCQIIIMKIVHEVSVCLVIFKLGFSRMYRNLKMMTLLYVHCSFTNSHYWPNFCRCGHLP